MACQNVTIEEISTTVQVGACSIIVRIPHCSPAQGAANPPAWYASLPYYDSVDAALLDGLSVGKIFKASALNNMGLLKGSIVEIT